MSCMNILKNIIAETVLSTTKFHFIKLKGNNGSKTV